MRIIFIYLFSRYHLDIYLQNYWIIGELRNRCEAIMGVNLNLKRKKNRIKKEKGKNANDSAMNRNFPLILHGDILSLLLLFPIFTNVRINWQSGFLAVDRRCIRAASSRTGFLLKHEARSTASVMRSFHRVTYRLAHHSWFSISRQKTWPAFSKKKKKRKHGFSRQIVIEGQVTMKISFVNNFTNSGSTTFRKN